MSSRKKTSSKKKRSPRKKRAIKKQTQSKRYKKELSKQHIFWITAGLLVAVAVLFTVQGVADKSGEEVCDLKDNNGDGYIDEEFVVTCEKDEDCGPTGRFGDRYCKGNEVWQGAYVNSCIGTKGTCLSECAGKQTEERIEVCERGCKIGSCR